MQLNAVLETCFGDSGQKGVQEEILLINRH